MDGRGQKRYPCGLPSMWFSPVCGRSNLCNTACREGRKSLSRTACAVRSQYRPVRTSTNQYRSSDVSKSNAPVAQWIEYCPPKAGVAGSIPAGRTTFLQTAHRPVLARRYPSPCTPPFADTARLCAATDRVPSRVVVPCGAHTAAINPLAPRRLPSLGPAGKCGSRRHRHRGSRRGYVRRGYPGSCG